MSDHCPILIEIQQNSQIKGPGYWKLNVTHLTDKVFVDEVNKIIDYAEFRYSECNPMNKWEMIKQDIKEYAMQYSSEKAKRNKKHKETLERQLRACHKRLHMINLKSDKEVTIIQKTNEKINQIMGELRKISMYRAQGLMLRSKVHWFEEGEKI